MQENNHLIGRQVLDLRIGAEQDAFRVQNDISFALRHRILPRLETVFDRMAVAGRVVRIDRIEIDLGTLDPERLEVELEEKLLRSIEAALETHIQARQGAPQDVSSGLREIAPDQSVLETWAYFLENGILPWWQQFTDHPAWEAAIIAALTRAPQAAKPMAQRLARESRMRQRLVDQFSQPVLEALLLSQQGTAGPGILSLREILAGLYRHFFSGKISPQAGQDFFWSVALSLLAPPRGEADGIKALIEAWVMALSVATGKSLAETLNACRDALAQAGGLAQEKQGTAIMRLLDDAGDDPDKLLTHAARENTRPDRHSNEIDPSRLDAPAPEAGHLPDSPAKDATVQSKTGKNTVSPDEHMRGDQPLFSLEKRPEKEVPLEDAPAPSKAPDAMYLRNAGLVILHPFLRPFLENVGLVQGNAFVDAAAQVRAVHLLEYLVRGETDVPEYELALNKILCGLPLSQPVGRDMVLSAQEQEESEKLLRVTIEHWQALKNTSPDGLRFNYLLRAGKLSRKDDCWLLQVEHQTHDLLLNRLPWGLGMIRLSWMERLLLVEWAH